MSIILSSVGTPMSRQLVLITATRAAMKDSGL
jgi:hypothetical protein